MIVVAFRTGYRIVGKCEYSSRLIFCPLAPNPAQQTRIRELFRRLAEESDPVALKDLQAELRHLLTVQAPLQKPTPRQHQIIAMVAEGLKNREIAANIGIAPLVVRNYLRSIYAKIGVHNRLELALWFEGQVYEGKLQRRPE